MTSKQDFCATSKIGLVDCERVSGLWYSYDFPFETPSRKLVNDLILVLFYVGSLPPLPTYFLLQQFLLFLLGSNWKEVQVKKYFSGLVYFLYELLFANKFFFGYILQMELSLLCKLFHQLLYVVLSTQSLEGSLYSY